MKVDRLAIEELRGAIEGLRLYAHFITRMSRQLLGASSETYEVIHDQLQDPVSYACHEAQSALRKLELSASVRVPTRVLGGPSSRA